MIESYVWSDLPKRPMKTEVLRVKTIDDLVKISEELGKPIIFYESEDKTTYSYYVIDEDIFYKFELKFALTKLTKLPSGKT